jgi:hypothetical protein
MGSLFYWTTPLIALYLLQPKFGLNRFGRWMAILYAFISVPMAVLAQWNSRLSETQLANALLVIAVVYEALAVAVLVVELKQRGRGSQG